MHPSKFRLMAAPDRSETAVEIEKLLRDGRSVGSPFLEIGVDDYKNPTKMWVEGHDGRGRSDAIKAINGDSVRIPVHIFFKQRTAEIRARHITLDMLNFLNEPGCAREKSTSVVGMDISLFYLMGKSIHPSDASI